MSEPDGGARGSPHPNTVHSGKYVVLHSLLCDEVVEMTDIGIDGLLAVVDAKIAFHPAVL